MPDSLIGRTIDGDFVIEERLGQGAMAVVYKAFQISVNRHVALKVILLNEGQGLQEDFRKRFAHEAEIIAKLEHIHILPIYAYGINDEMAYLAMRWLKGGSLSQILRQGKLTLDRAVDIFNQVAKGLAYAHSKGVIHRDLKPSNIMLDDTGNAYLTDFGLAKLVEGSGEITRSGTIVGTPAYMSPEQLRGEDLDYRSDVYSLGVILYNMMVGRLPFDTSTSNLVSVIYQHLEKPPVPPRELNPDIPEAVAEVIMKALQKDRKDRFTTPLDMARALNIALGRPTNMDSMTNISLPRRPSSITSSGKPGGVFGGNYLIWGVIVVLITVVGLLVKQTADNQYQLQMQQTAESATAIAAAWTPTPLPVAMVLPGESIHGDQVIPSEAQIATARARLGTEGFIAYITCNQASEFHAALSREVRDLTTQYGLKIEVHNSESDETNQIPLIEKARADGATGIILCPLKPDLLKDTLVSIQESGMPLVIFGEKIPSYGGVLIGGDNYLLGLEPGRWAGKMIRDEMGGKADVITLDYPSLDFIVARANGLEDGMKEFAPEANIIGRYPGAVPEAGKESVAKLIQDGVHFNVILSINDAGAYGAIEAMKEAGWDCNSVAIVSVDAEALAQEYIRDGCFIRGSVRGAREEVAQGMVNAMVQLLSGSTIAETIQIQPGPIITKTFLETEDEAGTQASPTASS